MILQHPHQTLELAHQLAARVLQGTQVALEFALALPQGAQLGHQGGTFRRDLFGFLLAAQLLDFPHDFLVFGL